MKPQDITREARLRAQLDEALAHAGATHEWDADVLPMLRSGQAQFWGRGDAGIVTFIRSYPRVRALDYWLVAGDMAHALKMQPEIDAWAREQGCTHATAVGRVGWQKILPAEGWKHAGAWFTKGLEA